MAEERRRQENVPGGRPVRREVTLTAIEDAALVVAAEKEGVTVPRYLVQSALRAGGFEIPDDRKDVVFAVMQLRGQLARVGNNLNQMAHRLNALGEVDPSLGDAVVEVRSKIRGVDEVLDLLSSRVSVVE